MKKEDTKEVLDKIHCLKGLYVCNDKISKERWCDNCLRKEKLAKKLEGWRM